MAIGKTIRFDDNDWPVERTTGGGYVLTSPNGQQTARLVKEQFGTGPMNWHWIIQIDGEPDRPQLDRHTRRALTDAAYRLTRIADPSR